MLGAIFPELEAQDVIPPRELDAYIAAAMKEFQVPGAGIAIVKDGKVVVAKGYGIKKLGESQKVDGRTLFGIASNTKAFLATTLAQLVEDGKLEWDKHVIDYLPWFQLSDPYVTRELMVRDLLVHSSGLNLGAGDLLWWPPSTYKRKEIVRRLRGIPLSTSFRSTYAYDNVLYIAAGELVEAVSGKTWEEFVTERILRPVGMSGTLLLSDQNEIPPEAATPHAFVEGKLQQVKPFLASNSNPAAGIHSNAEDIAKWMMVQLDSGRLGDGGQIFSTKTTKQLWSLVTPIPISDPAPELSPIRTSFLGYALGFSLREYRGKKVVTHNGALPGFYSRVTMIPELKLGIAVLTNQESGSAFNAISYYILDRYLNARPFDWVRGYSIVSARNDSSNKAQEREAALSRDSLSKPSLSFGKYAGTYRDEWYGDMTIAEESGKLSIKFSHTPWLSGELIHWQYDTFLARWTDREVRADAYVTFSLNPDGSVEQVKMEAFSPATDFSFDFHDLLLKPVSQEQTTTK